MTVQYNYCFASEKVQTKKEKVEMFSDSIVETFRQWRNNGVAAS